MTELPEILEPLAIICIDIKLDFLGGSTQL
jgi:hypothetical protein